MICRYRSRMQGSALIAASIFVVALGLLIAGYFEFIVRASRITREAVEYVKAQYVAEAGIARAVNYLTHISYPPQGTVTLYDEMAVGAGKDRGKYTVTIERYGRSWNFDIHSVGTMVESGVLKRLYRRIRYVSFARYVYFTDSERLPNGWRIYFIGGDVLNGPVHSNDQIAMYNGPVFNHDVSSTTTPYVVGSPDPTYHPEHPPNWASPPVTLPLQFTPLITAANDNGFVLNEDGTKPHVHLDFKDDGTIDYFYSIDGDETARTFVSNLDPTGKNGVILVDNNAQAHVKGTVEGEFTVFSEQSIFVEDDLKYKVDPRTPDEDLAPGEEKDDYMGLVAEHAVVVSDNAANRDNCEIHASILANGTDVPPTTSDWEHDSFYVENNTSPGPRGTLSVLGGIIQQRRGIVGWSSGGTVTKGYLKNYVYDERLLESAPPYFPLTGEFEVDYYKEVPKSG